MATGFDQLQRAAFGGIQFPVESYEIVGGIRDAVHEYGHVDGGDPERLGRKLYTVRMKPLFHGTFKEYPNLYPSGLSKLIEKFEASSVEDLVVPTTGTMRAYCVNWTRRVAMRVRSGEALELEFREDSIGDRNYEVVDFDRDKMYLGPLEVELGKSPDLLSQVFGALADLQNAVNEVTSYLDTAEMYGNLLEAKLLQVKAIVEELHRFDGMQEAENYRVFNALQDLAAATSDALDNIQGKSSGLEEYIVPTVMSVQQISMAVFGDASGAMDILQLNPIEKAHEVRAGTVVRYYPRT